MGFCDLGSILNMVLTRLKRGLCKQEMHFTGFLVNRFSSHDDPIQNKAEKLLFFNAH